MKNRFQFAVLLEDYIKVSGYSLSQLARLSRVPKRTIANWKNSQVAKPRSWHDVAKLSAALHLDEADTSRLLKSAGFPSVAELLAKSKGNQEDLKMLSAWIDAVQRREVQSPFQAVGDIPHFVSRQQGIKLANLLMEHRHKAIYVLQGMAGAGKTALAAHLAHELRDQFIDGVLWAQVNVSDKASILQSFASAFGRDISQYKDLDSRSRVVRELLANKRVLIVFDNVQDDDQVEILLPSLPSACAVIITTQNRDLWVTRTGIRFEIGAFDKAKRESLKLFAKHLNKTRLRQEEAALTKIADLLEHLPFAIDLVASRIAHTKHPATNEILNLLRSEKHRLGELTYGNKSLRLSFELSFQHLTTAHQQFFSSLGTFGGEDFSVEAVSHVEKRPLDTAQTNLDQLVALELVREGRTGRYRLHPLLCDYAREKNNRPESYDRMIDYFSLYLANHKRDFASLDLEKSNILHAIRMAFEFGRRETAIQITNSLYEYLEVRGLHDLANEHLVGALEISRREGKAADLANTLLNLSTLATQRGNFSDAETYAEEGLKVAQSLGQDDLEIQFLQVLGSIRFNLGDYGLAGEFYQDALERARAMQDQEQTTKMLLNLGTVYLNGGDYAKAEQHYQDAIKLAEGLNLSVLLVQILFNLGVLEDNRGNNDGATRYWKQGLQLAREIGFVQKMALFLANLGWQALDQNEYEEAEDHFQEGLNLARKGEYRQPISAILEGLGYLAILRKNYAQAELFLQEGLNIAKQINHRWRTCSILLKIGILYLEQAQPELATQPLTEAMGLAEKADFKQHVAEAYFQIARAKFALGDRDEAKRLGDKSIELFEAINHVQANEVRKWMSIFDGATSGDAWK